MHVVHLMASPFYGGPERQMLGLAQHLPPSTKSTFLCFAERGKAQAFIDQARTAGFDTITLESNFPRIFRCISEISSHLKNIHADILTCSGYKPDILGCFAARKVGIPSLSVSHGWTGATWKVRLYEYVDKMVLNWMDSVVAVSKAQELKIRRAGVSEAKVVTIRNAVGKDAFVEPDATLRQQLIDLFESPPKLLVGAAGRLSPEKGFEVLVDAAAQVLKKVPEAGFVVFGEGPLKANLERRIAEHGIAKRFLLGGFRSDLLKVLPNFDLSAMSSWTEGLPVILLETFAAGVPMVSTAVGGIPEVLVEGESGHLVPAGRADVLANRLTELLADAPRRQKMGEAARNRVRDHFSFEGQALAYQTLFDRLVRRLP